MSYLPPGVTQDALDRYYGYTDRRDPEQLVVSRGAGPLCSHGWPERRQCCQPATVKVGRLWYCDRHEPEALDA